MFEIGLIILGSIAMISLIIAVLIRLFHKSEFSDEYEIDFEERHKNHFISRYYTDTFELTHHND